MVIYILNKRHLEKISKKYIYFLANFFSFWNDAILNFLYCNSLKIVIYIEMWLFRIMAVQEARRNDIDDHPRYTFAPSFVCPQMLRWYLSELYQLWYNKDKFDKIDRERRTDGLTVYLDNNIQHLSLIYAYFRFKY